VRTILFASDVKGCGTGACHLHEKGQDLSVPALRLPGGVRVVSRGEEGLLARKVSLPLPWFP
jgi:hypothetical protein